MTAEPTAPLAPGRHARGTWTPDVAPGTGGRRRLPPGDGEHVGAGGPDAAATQVVGPAVGAGVGAGGNPVARPTRPLPDVAAPGPVSPLVGSGVGASPHAAARAVLSRDTTVAIRGPIRYADVPGVPRRSSEALWGPPIPAAGA